MRESVFKCMMDMVCDLVLTIMLMGKIGPERLYSIIITVVIILFCCCCCCCFLLLLLLLRSCCCFY